MPRKEVGKRKGVSSFSFGGLSTRIPAVIAPVCIPQQCRKVPFPCSLPSSPYHLLPGHHLGTRWNVSAVLICVSLMAISVELFFFLNGRLCFPLFAVDLRNAGMLEHIIIYGHVLFYRDNDHNVLASLLGSRQAHLL